MRSWKKHAGPVVVFRYPRLYAALLFDLVWLRSYIVSESNPLYIGGLFHYYMLDESICHFRVSGLFCLFYSIFDGKCYWQTM